MFLFEYLVVELSVHVCEEITEVWKMNHLKELEETVAIAISGIAFASHSRGRNFIIDRIGLEHKKAIG